MKIFIMYLNIILLLVILTSCTLNEPDISEAGETDYIFPEAVSTVDVVKNTLPYQSETSKEHIEYNDINNASETDYFFLEVVSTIDAVNDRLPHQLETGKEHIEYNDFKHTPDELKKIEWEYENAICNVNFNKIIFEQSKEYTEEDFKYDFPYVLYCDLKEKLILDLNGILSFDGDFAEFSFLSCIEYFKFDLNDDGIDDYLTKAIVGIKDGYSGGGAGQYVSEIYISLGDEIYKSIDCSLDNYVSILKTKTNGLYDILSGYVGNDVCCFDGENSYTIPYKSDKLFWNYHIESDNTICLMYSFDGNLQPNLDEYYVAIYIDDERVTEKVLYSCDMNGIPIKYTTNELSFHDGFKFYATLNSSAIDNYDFIMFNQLKFIPVE